MEYMIKKTMSVFWCVCGGEVGGKKIVFTKKMI